MPERGALSKSHCEPGKDQVGLRPWQACSSSGPLSAYSSPKAMSAAGRQPLKKARILEQGVLITMAMRSRFAQSVCIGQDCLRRRMKRLPNPVIRRMAEEGEESRG